MECLTHFPAFNCAKIAWVAGLGGTSRRKAGKRWSRGWQRVPGPLAPAGIVTTTVRSARSTHTTFRVPVPSGRNPAKRW